MNTRLLMRSPNIETVTGVANDTTTVELFIHQDGLSVPALPTFELSKPIPSNIITDAEYNVSEYLKDQVSHLAYTAPTVPDESAAVNEYVMLKTKSTLNGAYTHGTPYLSEYVVFNSYGLHSEGYNPTGQVALLDEGTYYCNEGGVHGGLYLHSANFAAVDMTIKYSSITGGATTVTTAITKEVTKNPYIHSTFATEGNLVEIFIAGVLQHTYRFELICEPKYTVRYCDFVNRFGAWQRVVFFKVSTNSVKVKSKKYSLMTPSSNYDVAANQVQTFNYKATEIHVCNTGFVPESYKTTMRDLAMSERVLLDGFPVNVTDSNIVMQSNINDKTINYKVSFESTNTLLNNII